ncbi:non-ribosomal peptide synthetase, partial [Marmoricola sp. Leaf446]|uniref:non-ribosomal peptide synthetase n=1 Tax=Marmoricola sp. Leaf446 TaxID=1736379 RepID=UPI001910882C
MSRTSATTTGVPLARELAVHGARPALISGELVVSYAELAARVATAGELLGATRRLVLLTADHEVDTLVHYLAALAGGHPVLLADPDREVTGLVEAYDPDVVVHRGVMTERRVGTCHDLHPDLALLLSTSGSTGSPRLVRLSAASVQANAASIASFLGVRPDDVAATTLPLHYCYGLSVLHTHLLRGAAVVLTSLSVVDRCFWELCLRRGVTSLAGVPHTFELLERVGFGPEKLPTLRYLTQAGGRMPAERVRRFAEAGRGCGVDLFVMYGQTEATARIAYLPPDLAVTRPEAVGVAVPGGHLRLEPPDAEVGELVYAGPNVMLGYAEGPADLALGRVVHELRTGDLARIGPDGLVEVVGRSSRFVKVCGLRLDLDRLEQHLATTGLQGLCAADGDRPVVAVVGGEGEVRAARSALAAATRLPGAAYDVHAVAALPRLASGKPDHRAVAGLVRPAAPGPAPGPAVPDADVAGLLGLVLGRDDVRPADTFVSLGGDSLSYVEASVRLEQHLGHLPVGWHTTPVGQLERSARPPRRGAAVETSVVLRALAIVAVVGTHGNLFVLTGGAHLLLGVLGFNFARFQLASPVRGERVRRTLGAVARVMVPSVLWVGGFALLASAYPWRTALMVNGLTGPEAWAEPAWHLWFLEALVALLLGSAALLAVPAVHRCERRWPFWLPFAIACVGLLTRYDLVSLRGGDEIHRAHVVLWLFAAGWAAARADTVAARAAVSLLLLVATPGFLEDGAREAVVLGGMLVLVWVPQLRLPRLAVRAAALLAAASLYVYLVHWQVYPHFEDTRPLLGVLLSLGAGVALWWAVDRATPRVRRAVRAPRTVLGVRPPWPQRRAV